MNPLVSIIVPIYNVSRFIKKCAESLLSQSYDNIEYIFIDDSSPDDSIKILKQVSSKYPERTIKIFQHETNLGLPSARNTGLNNATGDFILHCDGDDWLESDMIETMIERFDQETDIVYCDFFLSYNNNDRVMSNPSYTTGEELLIDGFLRGRTKYNVWNKLVRASLYRENTIFFPDGHSMGEDMTMIILSYYARKVVHVKKPLYHYIRTNNSAYTQTITPKNTSDTYSNANRIISFITDHYGNSLTREICFFKLNTKLPYLLSDSKEMHRVWKEWYPEANEFVLQNKQTPLRNRFLQWCGAHNLFTIVDIYYKFCYKFLYNILFK